jgi:arginyl-tRNA synthetase
MRKKDITCRIEQAILAGAERFFEKNVNGKVLPQNIAPEVQLTRDHRHGDLSTNIALKLAGEASMSPRDIAAGIVSCMNEDGLSSGLSDIIGKVENAGGFINFWFSGVFFRDLLYNITKGRKMFGSSSFGGGKKINIEYVSANPTGPLTIAHGRQAAVGDALSRILRFAGYDVTDEYYLNDTGRQIEQLGRSVGVRYRNLLGEAEDMPPDGYMGAYITEIAGELKEKYGGDLKENTTRNSKIFREYAKERILGMIKKDLDDFGVSFDVWTSQQSVEEDDRVGKMIRMLKEQGFVYEKDGAHWFASTGFGDDKDRVVIKSDSSFTYLAPDIAYHKDKFERGYDRLIDLLGPDHHGYIKRMKAAVQALGHPADSLDILIVQLVTLLRGGEGISMSTRKGQFISLREIIDEIGKDVARFCFLSRRLDSHLDFDIELIKKESADNPVYYIQYAHARICSIKKYGRKAFLKTLFRRTDLSLLKDPEEERLIRKLAEFPFAVHSSADALEPNRILVYLNDLARIFHSFYTKCRVVSGDIPLTKARLYLVECVRIVLANGLGLLNISLPEKM